MQPMPADTDPATPPGPPPSSTGRAVRAFGYVFAGVGSCAAVGLAIVLHALLFRADAARDARVLIGFAAAFTWLSAFAAAAVAQATPARVARRIPGRGWLVMVALLPFGTYTAASATRAWLAERQDPLYGYCERALSHRLAQRGIATPTRLAVDDGRLTLAVPAYPARRARWWVDVDADDTVGRRCTFHSAVLFGEDPVVLHIPLPMASREMPSRPFALVPGSMVVVRAVRLTLDPDSTALAEAGPQLYLRRMEMVYEVPAPKGSGRTLSDFVSAHR